MILDIKVVPNSKEDKVERQLDGSLKVWVKEKPIKGKASEAARKAIADYLRIKAADVEMKQTTSRKKKVTIHNINA